MVFRKKILGVDGGGAAIGTEDELMMMELSQGKNGTNL